VVAGLIARAHSREARPARRGVRHGRQPGHAIRADRGP
jgi:hypothetical protein